MIGTLIGLVQMLSNLSVPTSLGRPWPGHPDHVLGSIMAN
jgi:hypothetical protein